MTVNSRRLAKDPDWLAKVRANNESRRKPRPPKKPCLCGCGRLVNRNWVSGHNGRGINGFGKVKPKPKYFHCACGCGKMTKGSKFYFSHRQYSENSYEARQIAKQAKISAVTCKGGCEEFLWIVKGKHGHVYRHSHKPKIKPHLCECGCGKITTAPRFLRGHWAKTKTGRKTVSTSIKEYYSDPTKHHGWQGGKSFIEYPREFNESLKEQIRINNNHTCQICNYKWQSGELKLDVHHWTYDKRDINHLVAVCHQCHSKTNYNRNLWILYFFLLRWVG